jgi:hypothetical protein
MNIKEKLTCKYCKEIYNQPLTLTCCGGYLCRRHIDEWSSHDSDGFLCPLCNEQNKNQNFKVCKLIQDLIEMEVHKFELDPKYERILNILKEQTKNLETILNDPKRKITVDLCNHNCG